MRRQESMHIYDAKAGTSVATSPQIFLVSSHPRLRGDKSTPSVIQSRLITDGNACPEVNWLSL